MFTICFFVDGNGRITGLDEALSSVVTVVVFAAAFGAAGVLIARGCGRPRWFGIVPVVRYAAFLFPALGG